MVSGASRIGAAQTTVSKPTVTQDASCPYRDFAAFISAFSEQPNLQRRFTIFPLKYQDYDDDFNLKASVISSFEAVPTFNPEFGRTIFANAKQRKSQKLEIEIEREKQNEFRDVVLVVPDTGVNVHYLFKKTEKCWFLYEIRDTST